MTHETCADKLLDLAYGELSAREAREVEAHAASCEACRSELLRIRETRRIMSALPEEAPSADGERVLLAAARRAAEEHGMARRLPRWLLGATVVAASLVAVTVVSYRLAVLRGPSGRGDDAALLGEGPFAAAPDAAPGGAEPPAAMPRGAPAETPAPPPPEAPRPRASGGAGPRAADRPPPPATAPPRAPPAAAATPPGGAAPAEKAAREPELAAEAPRAADAGAAPSSPPSPRADRAPSSPRAVRAAPPEAAEASGASAPAEAPRERAEADAITVEERTFPGCEGESYRRVESDAAGRVVRYVREGRIGGRRLRVEHVYGPDGTLAGATARDLDAGGALVDPGALGVALPATADEAVIDAPARCGPGN